MFILRYINVNYTAAYIGPFTSKFMLKGYVGLYYGEDYVEEIADLGSTEAKYATFTLIELASPQQATGD